eukprot:TRINITY_DN6160_c0_g1_i1.p1 TRINITY_DN6160_c0_g1~~TRINITY_DN6160_c0_g1_i1.p1  ORF type:complete len:276 (-),score=40.95 TRINITY_DN6160_c0_g1_i1:27-854(-)
MSLSIACYPYPAPSFPTSARHPISILQYPHPRLRTSLYSVSPVSSSFRCSATPNSVNGDPIKEAAEAPHSSQREATALKDDSNDDKRDKRKPRKTAETTDWIASFLTRRFGLAGGLAWFAFLAFGVISEQVKTRFEVSQEIQNIRDADGGAEEVILPNGIRYVDVRLGGGASPKEGDLVVIGLKGRTQSAGTVFVDTKNRQPLVFLFGVKPYVGGICEGLVHVIKSMKAGGIRKAIIPPEFGFGKDGSVVQENVVIPPDSTLEYTVELQKISVPP